MKNLLAIPVVLAAAVSGFAEGQSYTLLGVPSGVREGVGYGLSDSGLAVVGWSMGPGDSQPGFRWTAETGRVDFAGVNGTPENTRAFGISGDGRWAVGDAYRQNLRRKEAFRFVQTPVNFSFLACSPGGRSQCPATRVLTAPWS